MMQLIMNIASLEDPRYLDWLLGPTVVAEHVSTQDNGKEGKY